MKLLQKAKRTINIHKGEKEGEKELVNRKEKILIMIRDERERGAKERRINHKKKDTIKRQKTNTCRFSHEKHWESKSKRKSSR